MAKDFEIRPGNYVVPKLGTVNTRLPLTDEKKVALYLNKSFPFITLLPGGVKVLKKAKLKPEDVSNLIRRAKSVEEIDMLLEVRSNQILRRIAEFSKSKFE